MKRLLLSLTLTLLAGLASAKLTKAAWSTSPSAPIYVGQPYSLCLTLETDENETVTFLQLAQAVGLQPDDSVSEVVDGRKQTTFRWHRAETKADRVEVPSMIVSTRVLRTVRMGFGSSSVETDARIQAPDFAYEVVPLPAEAEGAPLGVFEFTLTADAPKFTPGDVHELTLEARAKEGVLPEGLAPVLDPVEGVRIYPFRKIGQTSTRALFKAYVMIESEAPVTFALPPMRVFDLTTRSLRELPIAPLTLTPLTEAERASAAEAEAEQRPAMGQPLHFAPAEKSPVVGVVGESWTVEETSGEWSRIRSGNAEGWLRSVLLKKDTP